MREIWGSLSVNDHNRSRALMAEVLLFDRVVMPVPPTDDTEEQKRWRTNRWDPTRQRRMLDILGDGPSDTDLAVTIPWTQTKRSQFRTLSDDRAQVPQARCLEREQLLRDLQLDASQLINADAYQISRMILTREYDSQEESYARNLPQADVEAVVPAYNTFKAADSELLLRTDTGLALDASLIGWNLFLPAESSWSDEVALEHAAKIARNEDYRGEREIFRDWWRQKIGFGTPPELALRDLVQRADKLNAVVKKMDQKTRVLRSFAILGGGVGIAGVWFPPLAVAGGCMMLVGVGADWLWRARAPSPVLAPAAMFTDARKQLGWG
jgi:hypothetical protein